VRLVALAGLVAACSLCPAASAAAAPLIAEYGDTSTRSIGFELTARRKGG
jgi:hypothetical protein